VQVERTDESNGVLAHALDGVRGIAARSRHARIVEEHHRAISAESIGNRRIPMIETVAEVLHKTNGTPVSLPNRR
jgi:hypothetical protein